jgi:hypothetical protein
MVATARLISGPLEVAVTTIRRLAAIPRAVTIR